MATPTPKSAAETMVSRLTGAEPQPKDEDLPEVEVLEEDSEVESTEEDSEEETETEETEEDTEEEIPEKIKEILNKNRKITRQAEAENAELKKKLAALENPDAPAEEPAPVDDKYKKLFVTTAAKSALAAAGFDKGTERFVKMIDFDDLEVSEDGTIEGLTEQVESLKKEFADLLIVKAPVKKVIKSDASGRREPTPAAKSSASRLSDQLRG